MFKMFRESWKQCNKTTSIVLTLTLHVQNHRKAEVSHLTHFLQNMSRFVRVVTHCELKCVATRTEWLKFDKMSHMTHFTFSVMFRESTLETWNIFSQNTSRKLFIKLNTTRNIIYYCQFWWLRFSLFSFMDIILMNVFSFLSFYREWKSKFRPQNRLTPVNMRQTTKHPQRQQQRALDMHQLYWLNM